MLNGIVPGSFRDPCGFLFHYQGRLYRQINRCYQDNYDHLMQCGLYDELVKSGLLISHHEVDVPPPVPETAYMIIRPEVVRFISYPYEWCSSQLQDAALTTLKIQKKALDYGMSLKDANAYNIQFIHGTPRLIDTLSLEKYVEGRPWVAYRQFCQHFLAPLALMSYTDIRLNQLSKVFLDGIPLDLAGTLLPFRSCFRFSLLTHIHLHGKSQKYFADKRITKGKDYKMGHVAFQGLIDNLESAVTKLKWRVGNTEWADYYDRTNYSQEAYQHKKQLVTEFLERVQPQSVLDMGANIGVFSRISGNMGIPTLSPDLDPAAVEQNYRDCRQREDRYLMPLYLDLTNPSPAMGWENRERMSFWERNPADTTMALALIHHLAISNNLPLGKLAAFFHKISPSLIIEFVPKTDSQVQRLLASREDIFPHYQREVFEQEFQRYFIIDRAIKINDSERYLYLMKRVSQ